MNACAYWPFAVQIARKLRERVNRKNAKKGKCAVFRSRTSGIEVALGNPNCFNLNGWLVEIIDPNTEDKTTRISKAL